MYFTKKIVAAGGKIYGSNRYEAGHMHTIDLSLLARIAGVAGPVQPLRQVA